MHGYEEWGPALVGAAARDVRGRGLGRARAAARARARPLRDQAALLPRRRRRAVVRVGARRAAARRHRPRRARGVPRVQLDPGAALDLPRHPQAAARPHADLAGRPRRRSSASRGTGPLPARHDEDEAELVEECRARLRDSVRAHLVADVPVGVLLSGGVDSGALAALAAEESSERGAHVLDRLRGGVVRRAGRRARGRAALRHDPPRARRCGPTRRCSCPRSPTRSTSRSPTRRRCRRTSSRSSRPRTSRSRSPARAATSSSAATTPTSPTCSPSASAPLAALARPLVERLPTSTRQRELRLQGEALRARRAPAAARASSRLEGDLLRRRARRADRAGERASTRSARYRERFAETEGHELLTRLQDVDFGLYLVDDLLTKTDRASMAWSLEARVPFMDTVVANFAFSLPVRSTRCAASRRSGCCGKAVEPLLPRRGRARPQARLLDPGRRVAARRARAVRARDALARHDPPAGLPRSRRRSRACSTTTSPAARTSRASSGGCSRSRSGTSATSRASGATRSLESVSPA